MPLAATVSGSFHRNLSGVCDAVAALRENGVRVLSPADPRVVEEVGQLLFLASDIWRSIRLVQDRHLQAIANSDFLWLVCPDGYIGPSVSLEIGFALANNLPVYSQRLPDDLTLRHYVELVGDVREVVAAVRPRRAKAVNLPSLLLDADVAIETAHYRLDTVATILNEQKRHQQNASVSNLLRQHRLLMDSLSLPIRH